MIKFSLCLNKKLIFDSKLKLIKIYGEYYGINSVNFKFTMNFFKFQKKKEDYSIPFPPKLAYYF